MSYSSNLLLSAFCPMIRSLFPNLYLKETPRLSEALCQCLKSFTLFLISISNDHVISFYIFFKKILMKNNVSLSSLSTYYVHLLSCTFYFVLKTMRKKTLIFTSFWLFLFSLLLINLIAITYFFAFIFFQNSFIYYNQNYKIKHFFYHFFDLFFLKCQ